MVPSCLSPGLAVREGENWRLIGGSRTEEIISLSGLSLSQLPPELER